MKTPIQELIDHYKKYHDKTIDPEPWLEMEKKMMCKFWVEGNHQGWEMNTDWEEDAERYYDSLFKEKK